MARLKNEKESAEYIGLEVATFRAWVESGRLPQPIPDCGKYDAKALDLALDRISGINSPTNALDAWRVTKGAKNAGAA
jgi:predicted site-specific integrase-resolvase